MTNTQTPAGKKLPAAAKKQLNDANDHLQRALERHKALGDQMDNVREMSEGDEDTRADLNDLHADASDMHRALGRSIKACQRCVRAAMKNAKPAASADDDDDADEEEDTETSAGDGNGDDQRSADLRRRQAELTALSQKT